MGESAAFVELYRATSLPEAHMLRLLLEQAEIDVRLENETLQSALGEVPLGWATAPRVLIAVDREADARRILQDFLAVAQAAHNPYRAPQASTEFDTGLKGLPPIPPLEISRREAWLEVAAVLAAVALPNIVEIAVQWVAPGHVERAYWAQTLYGMAYVLQMLFLAWYIIRRNGPKDEQYGWTFRWSDLAWGFLFWTVAEFMTLFVVTLGPPDLDLRPDQPIHLQARPQGFFELGLMCVSWSLVALLDELALRAYLISRLSSLFQSRVQAILAAAIVYTISHAYHGLNYAALQFAIALAFGCLYVLLPRIWPLAIGHALHSIRLALTP